MANKEWELEHIGFAVHLWLCNQTIATVIKRLRDDHGVERSTDAVTTIINKVFWTDQQPHCPVKAKWRGEGMPNRVGYAFSKRENKRIIQGYKNGMDEDKLALATGRTRGEIADALRRMSPSYNQQRSEGFGW